MKTINYFLFFFCLLNCSCNNDTEENPIEYGDIINAEVIGQEEDAFKAINDLGLIASTLDCTLTIESHPQLFEFFSNHEEELKKQSFFYYLYQNESYVSLGFKDIYRLDYQEQWLNFKKELDLTWNEDFRMLISFDLSGEKFMSHTKMQALIQAHPAINEAYLFPKNWCGTGWYNLN